MSLQPSAAKESALVGKPKYPHILRVWNEGSELKVFGNKIKEKKT